MGRREVGWPAADQLPTAKVNLKIQHFIMEADKQSTRVRVCVLGSSKTAHYKFFATPSEVSLTVPTTIMYRKKLTHPVADEGLRLGNTPQEAAYIHDIFPHGDQPLNEAGGRGTLGPPSAGQVGITGKLFAPLLPGPATPSLGSQSSVQAVT